VATAEAGHRVELSDAVLPVVRRTNDDKLQVIGTAFFVGPSLVATARHVIDEAPVDQLTCMHILSSCFDATRKCVPSGTDAALTLFLVSTPLPEKCPIATRPDPHRLRTDTFGVLAVKLTPTLQRGIHRLRLDMPEAAHIRWKSRDLLRHGNVDGFRGSQK
jgi:hypothetical protein